MSQSYCSYSSDTILSCSNCGEITYDCKTNSFHRRSAGGGDCRGLRPNRPVAGDSSAQVQQAVKLAERNWDHFNKAQVEKLIATYGKASPTYNPAKPPMPCSTGITRWFSWMLRKQR